MRHDVRPHSIDRCVEYSKIDKESYMASTLGSPLSAIETNEKASARQDLSGRFSEKATRRAKHTRARNWKDPNIHSRNVLSREFFETAYSRWLYESMIDKTLI